MNPFLILVADDDPDDFLNLKQAFDDLDYDHDTDHVLSGELLVSRIQDLLGQEGRLPDLILPDINMPEVNGIQALQQLRKIEALSKVPVFMHSTCADHGQVKICFSLGANGYLYKGSTYTEVLQLAGEITNFLRLKDEGRCAPVLEDYS
jgi:CheY-like chemotaxis protein